MFIIRTFVFIIRTRRKARLLYNILDKVHFWKAETGKSASTFGKSYLPSDSDQQSNEQCRPWGNQKVAHDL